MRTHRYGVAAVVLAVALLAAGLAGEVMAAGNTLKVDPATSTVAKDATFTVKVIQNASVATSGTQVTIGFDKAILQVQSVTRGSQFAGSPLFLGADAAAISAANKSGKLKTVAAAFFPPGTVAAGNAEFLVVGFKATGCGESNLALPVSVADAAMLDGRTNTYGQQLKVTTTPGKVVVDCGGLAPTGSATPLPSGVTPAPSASGDVAGATLDPLASPSEDPLAQPSTDPAAASGDPAAGALTPPPTASETTADPDHDAWLTFALAALAVAAAGLALLIAIIVLASIIAGFVGSFLLLRYLRRGSAGATATAAGPDGTGPEGTGPDGNGDAAPDSTESTGPDGDGEAAAEGGEAPAAAPTEPGPGANEAPPAPDEPDAAPPTQPAAG